MKRQRALDGQNVKLEATIEILVEEVRSATERLAGVEDERFQRHAKSTIQSTLGTFTAHWFKNQKDQNITSLICACTFSTAVRVYISGMQSLQFIEK